MPTPLPTIKQALHSRGNILQGLDESGSAVGSVSNVTITGRPYHFREDGHEKTSSVIFSLLLVRVGQLVDQLTAII